MEEKMITHYRSSHKILLVGEGDFSFSLCLAHAFGTAVNMVATSLDSRSVLEMDYTNASTNLTKLKALGCTIVHDVNVRTMDEHPLLKPQNFDRIIYNFPHAGFIASEIDDSQIRLHKVIVSGFLKNAKKMLTSNGEIHITHKTTYPFNMWNIKELAKLEELVLVREEKFDQQLYPGYNNKRGAGSQCDQTFYVGKSSTFMFACVEADDKIKKDKMEDVIQKNKKKSFKDMLLKKK